jgi:hypothetical protein
MQYINPFQLFNLDPQNTTQEDIESLIASANQEFSSYGAYEEVNYKGTKLLLTDLRRLLNELNDPHSFEMHKEVFTHKNLLNFLEFGHLEYLKKRVPYKEDPQLMEFIAPYFAEQYSQTLGQALKTADKETIECLARQDLPRFDEYGQEYYQAAVQVLDKSLKSLQEMQENPRMLYLSERQLMSTLPDKTIELYNLLPPYFTEARDLLAHEMLKLGELLLRQYARRDGALALVKQAKKLELSPKLEAHLDYLSSGLKPRLKNFPIWFWILCGIISLYLLLQYLLPLILQ